MLPGQRSPEPSTSDVAVVMLTEVNYRTGARLDMAALTPQGPRRGRTDRLGSVPFGRRRSRRPDRRRRGLRGGLRLQIPQRRPRRPGRRLRRAAHLSMACAAAAAAGSATPPLRLRPGLRAGRRDRCPPCRLAADPLHVGARRRAGCVSGRRDVRALKAQGRCAVRSVRPRSTARCSRTETAHADAIRRSTARKLGVPPSRSLRRDAGADRPRRHRRFPPARHHALRPDPALPAVRTSMSTDAAQILGEIIATSRLWTGRSSSAKRRWSRTGAIARLTFSMNASSRVGRDVVHVVEARGYVAAAASRRSVTFSPTALAPCAAADRP